MSGILLACYPMGVIVLGMPFIYLRYLRWWHMSIFLVLSSVFVGKPYRNDVCSFNIIINFLVFFFSAWLRVGFFFVFSPRIELNSVQCRHDRRPSKTFEWLYYSVKSRNAYWCSEYSVIVHDNIFKLIRLIRFKIKRVSLKFASPFKSNDR